MDQVVRNGLVFDGSEAPGQPRDVLISGGKATLLAPGTPVAAEEIDAAGCWVMPGFVDLHTHYDGEVEVLPSLSESLRHGVTTVLLGSCGLSMAMGDPTDLADMFCRVEGIPRDIVLPLLKRIKDWETPAAYLDHLGTLPLGPNVTALLGHSTIRAHVMGLGRSVDASVRPSADELGAMGRWLEHSLDAGYLGLSINTLPWDKMDGEAFRSRPTPSVFARWSEYRHFTRILRKRDALFQAVPDVSTKLNAILFFLETLGLFRPRLKTMMITLMDTKSDRLQHRLFGTVARIVNEVLGGSLRLQSLPNPFDMWIDGLEAPVFEEFGAGTEALHHVDPAERAALLRDPAYRKKYRRQWRFPFMRAYHRDLDDTEIIECPDRSLVGKSFGALAAERKVDPIDLFLDLQAEHGNALRWYTVMGNDRPREVEWISSHPSILVGFSDAGAHLRNMAHYNYPLRLLKRVRDAAAAGKPFMTIDRAVHRLTGEIGDYLGIDAGRLRDGARADLVIVDPNGLTDEVEKIHEAPMEGFGDVRRLVRRNDGAVRGVWVNGRLAWQDGKASPDVGREKGFGTVLRAAHTA